MEENFMNENFKDEIFIATLERTIRRLWILCIILILLLVGTNALWLYYESQFEDIVTTESIETETSDGGDATGIIGNRGDRSNRSYRDMPYDGMSYADGMREMVDSIYNIMDDLPEGVKRDAQKLAKKIEQTM